MCYSLNNVALLLHCYLYIFYHSFRKAFECCLLLYANGYLVGVHIFVKHFLYSFHIVDDMQKCVYTCVVECFAFNQLKLCRKIFYFNKMKIDLNSFYSNEKLYIRFKKFSIVLEAAKNNPGKMKFSISSALGL